VTFDENSMIKGKASADVQDSGERILKQVELECETSEGEKNSDQLVEEEVHDSDTENGAEQQQPYSIAKDRPRREIRPPQKYAYADMVAYALSIAETVEYEEPSSYREAVTGKEATQWTVAMNEEIESLHKNQTWELVKPPKGKRIVGCKWIYKRKAGIPGVEDARLKARLVAKGYSQQEGVDFNEVFSPVVKHSSIRVMLAIVSHFDLELEQLDVKTAFLHGELEEQIYMHQPEGFAVSGKEDFVYFLKKSLYGLK
jgi:hypothetical protein